jgi:hypothetical protein
MISRGRYDHVEGKAVLDKVINVHRHRAEVRLVAAFLLGFLATKSHTSKAQEQRTAVFQAGEVPHPEVCSTA